MMQTCRRYNILNKQLLLAFALLLVAIFSAGAIYASDVNGTETLDANVIGDEADMPVAVDGDVSNDNNISTVEDTIVVDSISSKHPTEIINPKDTIYYKDSYYVIL